MTFVINYFRYSCHGLGPCGRHPRENKEDAGFDRLITKAAKMARKLMQTSRDKHDAALSTTYAMRDMGFGSFGVNDRALAAYDCAGFRRRGRGAPAKIGRNARNETGCLFVAQRIAQKRCSLQLDEEKATISFHWRLSFSEHPHNSCYTPRSNDL